MPEGLPRPEINPVSQAPSIPGVREGAAARANSGLEPNSDSPAVSPGGIGVPELRAWHHPPGSPHNEQNPRPGALTREFFDQAGPAQPIPLPSVDLNASGDLRRRQEEWRNTYSGFMQWIDWAGQQDWGRDQRLLEEGLQQIIRRPGQSFNSSLSELFMDRMGLSPGQLRTVIGTLRLTPAQADDFLNHIYSYNAVQLDISAPVPFGWEDFPPVQQRRLSSSQQGSPGASQASDAAPGPASAPPSGETGSPSLRDNKILSQTEIEALLAGEPLLGDVDDEQRPSPVLGDASNPINLLWDQEDIPDAIEAQIRLAAGRQRDILVVETGHGIRTITREIEEALRRAGLTGSLQTFPNSAGDRVVFRIPGNSGQAASGVPAHILTDEGIERFLEGRPFSESDYRDHGVTPPETGDVPDGSGELVLHPPRPISGVSAPAGEPADPEAQARAVDSDGEALSDDERAHIRLMRSMGDRWLNERRETEEHFRTHPEEIGEVAGFLFSYTYSPVEAARLIETLGLTEEQRRQLNQDIITGFGYAMDVNRRRIEAGDRPPLDPDDERFYRLWEQRIDEVRRAEQAASGSSAAPGATAAPDQPPGAAPAGEPPGAGTVAPAAEAALDPEAVARRDRLRLIMRVLGFGNNRRLAELSPADLVRVLQRIRPDDPFGTSQEQAQPIIGEIVDQTIALEDSGELLYVVGPEVRVEILRGLPDAQRIQAERVLVRLVEGIEGNNRCADPAAARDSLTETLRILRGWPNESQRRSIGGLLARYKQDSELSPETARQTRLRFARRLTESGVSPDQAEYFFTQISDTQERNDLRGDFFQTLRQLGDAYSLAVARENPRFAEYERNRRQNADRSIDEIEGLAAGVEGLNGRRRGVQIGMICDRVWNAGFTTEEMARALMPIEDEKLIREILTQLFKRIKNINDDEHPWIRSWRSEPDYRHWETRQGFKNKLRVLVGRAGNGEVARVDVRELDLEERLAIESEGSALKTETAAGLPVAQTADERTDFEEWMDQDTIRRRQNFILWLSSLPRNPQEREEALIPSYQAFARLSLMEKPSLESITEHIAGQIIDLHYTPAQCYWILDRIGLPPGRVPAAYETLYAHVAEAIEEGERTDTPEISDNRFARIWEDDNNFINWSMLRLMSRGVTMGVGEVALDMLALRRSNSLRRAEAAIRSYDVTIAPLGNDDSSRLQTILQQEWNMEIALELYRAGITVNNLPQYLGGIHSQEARDEITRQFRIRAGIPLPEPPSEEAQRAQRETQTQARLNELTAAIGAIRPAAFSADRAGAIVGLAIQLGRIGEFDEQARLDLQERIRQVTSNEARVLEAFRRFYFRRLDELGRTGSPQEILNLFDSAELLGIDTMLPDFREQMDIYTPALEDAIRESGSIESLTEAWDTPSRHLRNLGRGTLGRLFPGDDHGHGH